LRDEQYKKGGRVDKKENLVEIMEKKKKALLPTLCKIFRPASHEILARMPKSGPGKFRVNIELWASFERQHFGLIQVSKTQRLMVK
jgi:hypothetical protein